MKMKLFFLILISQLFHNTIFGQTEINTKKNNLEFSVGYNSGSLKNLQFSPVARYDYSGLVYKLNYERTSKNLNLFQIKLDYLESELKSDLIPVLNLDYSKVDLSFSYLKQIYIKNKFSVHLGLQSYSNISIYAKSSSNRSIINQSFGVASQFTHQINEKHSLFSKLTIPFVLYRLTDTSQDIYSLNRHQSVLWNIEYKYSLSNQFDIKLSYDFNYDRLQIPNAFRELQYQLNLGINYKF